MYVYAFLRSYGGHGVDACALRLHVCLLSSVEANFCTAQGCMYGSQSFLLFAGACVFAVLCECVGLCCALWLRASLLCPMGMRVYAVLCACARLRCVLWVRVHAEMCGCARAFTVQGGCVCLCCALLGGKFLCCAARVRVCCVLWMPVPMLSPAGECLCYTVRVRVLHAVLCVRGMQVRVSVLHVSEHACCMLCSVGFVPMLCSEGTYLCYGLWVHAFLLCSVCACPCAVLCGHMSML